MPNYIRTKQIDQTDLSGFFIDTIGSQSGLLLEYISGVTLNETVLLTGNQNVSGIKTFVDGVNLNNIDNLNLSGVDIIITSGNVVLTNPVSAPNLFNITYNTGNQTISGIKTFATGIFAPNLVYNTGNQTISGNKTFINNLNISGDLTVAGTLRYNEIIDTTVTGSISGYTGIFQQVYANNLVYNTGTQTISGTKTFASFPTVNNTGIVYTLGNQDISGQKRFVDQDIVSTMTFNSPNQPSTFIGGFSGPGVFRFEVKPEYRPVVFPNPNYFYTGVNPGQPVEIYFNTGTSRWWYTVNNSFVDASPIVQALSSSARLPLSNWSGGNMRIYPTYTHNISHYTDGNDPIDVDRINGVAKTGNQTISGIKTFVNSGIFSLSGASALNVPNNPLSVVGSGNSYLQLNIQNRATGTTATADLVITANNGTDTTNYINLGINNSGYNDPAFSNGSGLDGYLFINGGNLDIGTQSPNTQIEFHAGGTTAARSIATISSSGLNVVSGNLTVRNTGVLLSGQNCFIMQASTSQSNFTDANKMYFFMGNGAGYTTSRLDRPTPFLQACTVKKVSFQLNQASASVVANNVTGFFINTTKNLTGIIFSNVSTSADGNFYHYVNNNLNMPFSEGDSGVFAVYTTTAGSTNVRSIATLYCYN